jgi:hypothetical protein
MAWCSTPPRARARPCCGRNRSSAAKLAPIRTQDDLRRLALDGLEDVRIEYDYTHLDDASNPYVVILFIQAQGTGGRAADISTWERPVASYPIYHGEMSNYSITYDNRANTVRARHNPGQADAGEFKYTDMFERDETYHITIEKSGGDFSMTATNARTGASRTFDFTGSASKGAIEEGRIGLRHMDDRSSRYGNFKIWASEYLGGGGNVTGGPGTGSGSG